MYPHDPDSGTPERKTPNESIVHKFAIGTLMVCMITLIVGCYKPKPIKVVVTSIETCRECGTVIDSLVRVFSLDDTTRSEARNVAKNVDGLTTNQVWRAIAAGDSTFEVVVRKGLCDTCLRKAAKSGQMAVHPHRVTGHYITINDDCPDAPMRSTSNGNRTVCRIPSGTELKVLGRRRHQAKFPVTWYKVEYNGLRIWVSEFVTTER